MDNNEKITEEVRKYERLYNLQSGRYKNFQYKEDLWCKIAKDVGVTVGAIKFLTSCVLEDHLSKHSKKLDYTKIVLMCIVACVAADLKRLTDPNIDLFKYNPSDVYTLPEDIDDDKPAIIFNGDVMKAKVEKLQSLSGKNKFKLDLKTQNGIEVSSVGKLKDDKTFVVSGSYSFTGADGKRYKTRYTADEYGYHPITELDLDIPDPQPLGAGLGALNNKFGVDDKKNRFQFLKQDFNLDLNQSPVRGSGQSGDDYSYSKLGGTNLNEQNSPSNGYDYQPPGQSFDVPDPSRLYLPVQ